MPYEANPRLVFERLFRGRKPVVPNWQRRAAAAATAKAPTTVHDSYEQGVIDIVRDEARDLRRKLGRNDQHKLDEYLDSVRSVEQRLDRIEAKLREELLDAANPGPSRLQPPRLPAAAYSLQKLRNQVHRDPDKHGEYIRHYKIKLMGLCFGEGTFVALGGEPGSVGNANPVLMYSRDGVAWGDYVLLPRGQILRRVAYGNGRFVGVGDRGRRSVSKNARVWQDAPGTRAIDTLADVAFGHGIFIGVGLHGLRMITEDGLKWGKPLRGEEGEHLNSVVWTGDRFVAAGPHASYFSPDGAAWKRTPTENGP